MLPVLLSTTNTILEAMQKHQPLLLILWMNGINKQEYPWIMFYTGKLCFAIHNLTEKDFSPEGQSAFTHS